MSNFEKILTKNHEPLWLDDPNLPQRIVIQRAANRFQCFQKDGAEFYSVGYALSRADIRRFLEGQEAQMMSEWGEDVRKERLVYSFAELARFG
jgi:hypothetical protein